MRYYRVTDHEASTEFVVRDGSTVYDIGEVCGLNSFRDLAQAACVSKDSMDTLTRRHIDEAPQLSVDRVENDCLRPIIPDEVWAAGVTYEISEQAREGESGMPEVYLDVYEGDRPELFFKATPSRTVGPGEAIGVREDSDWNVPEPELGLVLFAGEIVGYTVGNDVSSRAIEGDNPLYLPQAKVYDRSCAIGPCVASPESVSDPSSLEITMTIVRDNATVYTGSTSTAKISTSQSIVS